MKVLSLFLLIFTLTLQLQASPLPLSFSGDQNRELLMDSKVRDNNVAITDVNEAKDEAQFSSMHILLLIGLVGMYVVFLRKGESRNMRL